MSEQFPWDDIDDLEKDMVTLGLDPEQAADATAIWVAEHVDFTKVFPPPIGALVEAIDDPIARSGMAGKVLRTFRKLRPFRKRRNPEARASVGNG